MTLRHLWTWALMLLGGMWQMVVAQNNIAVQHAMGRNVDSLVNAVLVGEGVQVFNVKFNGVEGNVPTQQLGTFAANDFVYLYMDSGLVMTTGMVAVAQGPNISGRRSMSVGTGMYVDPMVQTQLNPSGTVNACATLEFDFVSLSPFVTMNYCFGSEEYPEFVCSNFNDVFAFFITGPDPQTGTQRTWNMACIPHTQSTANPNGIAVAINSVNDGSHSTGGSCYSNFSQYYQSNDWSYGVEYDGFTRKLAASATIVPCEQYHMHITICNIGDNDYDSGVFIESGSFSSPVAQLNLSNGAGDTIVHSHAVTVPLTVAGSDYSYGMSRLYFRGTARCGIDYLCISSGGDTLTPAFNSVDITDSSHTLTFVGAPGVVIEDTLDIEVLVQTSLCEQRPDLSTSDTLRFVLVEDDIVALRDTTIRCADTCRMVGVEVAYARRPLQFHWEPEEGIDHPDQQYSTAKIGENREYHVSAVDDMGNRGTATVSVIIGGDGVEEPQRGGIAVYPNPTDGLLHVEATGMREVRLVSAAGVCVYNRRCNSDRVAIDTAPYAEGIYVLQVTTTAGRHETPVVVQ